MVAAIGIGMLIVAARYLRQTRDHAAGRQATAGEGARNGLRNVLAIGAAMFGTLALFYAVAGAASWPSGLSERALYVYGFSSLRIVPYLPLMTGPLAFVASVVVDVLLYVVRMETLSTAPSVRQRLSAAIEHVRAKGHTAVVAAHSQGSVVAVDVIGRTLAAGAPTASRLITAGSPLHSLYARFLGSTPESRAADDDAAFLEPPQWINVSREGDYVGAGQERRGVKEINLGAGGHTGYWKSPALWTAVASGNLSDGFRRSGAAQDLR
jgi:hypothetical protein